MPDETSIHCPACHAELIVTGLTGGQRVLCAQCRAAFSLAGEPPAQRVCPKARVSLLLGLVSPLGLLLTGIPAIVLGLRALADIRRQPHALRGRVMAIGGIASGGFFVLACVVVLAVFLIPLVANYVKDAWYTTIVPPSSSWNWRNPTDGVDPAISDPDFLVRDNVGDGDEAYDLTATTTGSSGEEIVIHRIPLKGTIGPERHVLAISLHNRDGGSSDLRMAEISLRRR